MNREQYPFLFNRRWLKKEKILIPFDDEKHQEITRTMMIDGKKLALCTKHSLVDLEFNVDLEGVSESEYPRLEKEQQDFFNEFFSEKRIDVCYIENGQVFDTCEHEFNLKEEKREDLIRVFNGYMTKIDDNFKLVTQINRAYRTDYNVLEEQNKKFNNSIKELESKIVQVKAAIKGPQTLAVWQQRKRDLEDFKAANPNNDASHFENEYKKAFEAHEAFIRKNDTLQQKHASEIISFQNDYSKLKSEFVLVHLHQYKTIMQMNYIYGQFIELRVFSDIQEHVEKIRIIKSNLQICLDHMNKFFGAQGDLQKRTEQACQFELHQEYQKSVKDMKSRIYMKETSSILTNFFLRMQVNLNDYPLESYMAPMTMVKREKPKDV